MSHAVSQDQKQVRVEMSKTLMRQGRWARHNGWRTFVAFDESWFYHHTYQESMWLSGDEKAL
jgi:hypothetical protein